MWKARQKIKQLVDTVSSFSVGLPRWGQVSCPLLFRNNDRESTMSIVPVPKNQLSSSPVCSQRIPLGSKSPISGALNVERSFLESDIFLVEEIHKLRAEVIPPLFLHTYVCSLNLSYYICWYCSLPGCACSCSLVTSRTTEFKHSSYLVLISSMSLGW